MSAADLASLLTAIAAVLGSLAAILHSAQTRRETRKHKANPYVHAATIPSNGVPAPRQPSPGGQRYGPPAGR